MKKLAIFLILIMMFTLCSCETNKEEQALTVAVSIAPQKTFVEKICKDKVRVITMIPAGASAENYEMSPKDITGFSESDIYFSIGVPAEEKGILPHLAKDTLLVDLVSPAEREYPQIKIGEEIDPHIWLSPKRAIVMVREIQEQMSALDPENTDFYKDNADLYIEELKELDLYITNLFKDRKRKTFLISHPSYGYFAADYGLEMLTLEPDGKEATPKELSQIISMAENMNINVIFTQEEASKKQAELIAKELGAKVEILKPLSPDYIENLKETARLIYEAVN